MKLDYEYNITDQLHEFVLKHDSDKQWVAFTFRLPEPLNVHDFVKKLNQTLDQLQNSV